MKSFIFFLLTSILLILEITAKDIKEHIPKLQIPFIANKGQVNSHVAFYAQTCGSTVFITREGKIKYSLTNINDVDELGFVLQEEFISGQINICQGLNKASTKINYFLGNNQSEWIVDIPIYNTISLGNVYKDIEIKLKTQNNNVEKLFYIKPGADPRDIKIRLGGMNKLFLNKYGELIAESELGTISFTKPIAYQEISGNKKFVDVAYKIIEDEYSFSIGDYNPANTLIIDPLIASTFIGGSTTDGSYYTGDDIVIDNEGNIYITGTTTSTNFPTQLGVYNQNFNGGTDIYISKLSPDLSTLIASTYIGGNSNEEARDLVLDNFGNIYIAGITESSDFPTTIMSFDTSYNGGSTCPYGSGDAFISKLDKNLTQLKSSTFIGGSGHDNCSSIELDQNGNIFISGSTSSTDYPIMAGVYDSTHQSGGNFQDDIFISKLDSNLTILFASTYLGGSSDDFSEALSIDQSNNVYVAGWTSSTNLPTTPGCYDDSYNGYYYDAFISKFTNDLTNLPASTFLGGSSWEFVYGMCMDDSSNVYLTGHTASLNFPTSSNAYDNSYNGNAGPNYGDDVFVTKLDSSLSSLKASTYMGGSQWENGWSIQAKNNKVYVSGTTSSSNYPTSANAFSQNYHGGSKYAGDVFVSILDDNLHTLNASTFLGGTGEESIGSIQVDATGNVIVSGSTGSSDFPVSSAVYDTSYNGGSSDVFISIFDSLLSADVSLIKHESQPKTFKLYPNYPNPFNPTTKIKYNLPMATNVILKIYNVLGQEVKTLVNEIQTPGTRSVIWDATNNYGEPVSSGIYIYKIQTNKPFKNIQYRKMVFIE